VIVLVLNLLLYSSAYKLNRFITSIVTGYPF